MWGSIEYVWSTRNSPFVESRGTNIGIVQNNIGKLGLRLYCKVP